MSMIKFTCMNSSVFSRVAVTTVAILFLVTPITAIAGGKIVTQETLLDRIQIEDILIRYYVDISSGTGHDLAQYYTEDAVFDVNGMIAKGPEAIAKMYGGLDEESAHVGRRLHMLLNNPIITVNGDKATVWAIWSGVLNEDINKPPVMVDQGREYSELVKIDGRWYFKMRYITSDSNLPPVWKDTYKPRKFR
ncbi:MAG: nuclear transport factor 2 family protein [Deltaproteobacteria bacterium]|nr:nuclear transport factor 2 family protein [Deltaproteobacteria bacterium]